MGTLIAGLAVSHTAMMIRRFDANDAAHVRVHDAFDELRRELADLRPDAMVVVGSEHLNSFSYDAFPQLCLGVGSHCTGWGDAGVESAKLPIATGLADDLLRRGVHAGFDLAWAADPKLDHGFMAPLQLLRPEMDIPIVPVFQNASTEPLSPLWRCAQFGELVRTTVENRPADERVVVLGTGGLSHWVGTPRMGEINREFDEFFLSAVRSGDVDALTALDTAQITEQAGNGAQEVRNWVTVLAACRGHGSVVAYESVSDWATGIALARVSTS